MKVKLLDKNFLMILGGDVFLLAAAWYGAHLARFDLGAALLERP
jgi:hypothetical protein